MDNKEIASVWAAWQEVQEKKKLDPVGKADADIDNDGDVDSSDEYLKNRRKAVGKAMKKDDEKEDVKEGELPPALKKAAEKKKKDAKDGDDEKEDDKEEVDESNCKTRKEEDEEECPKCKGKGCDHCDGTGTHKVKKENPAIVALSQKKVKESALFSEEELAALEEKMKQPNDTGTPPEPFMSTSSPNDKKQMAAHKAGSDKKLEDYEEMGEMDAAKAGKGGPGQSSARKGDNLKNGDNAMPTPPKAKGQ
jgi:hypothetical protein